MDENIDDYSILSHSLAPDLNEQENKGIEDEILTIYFDGAKPQFGNGVGIVFISPQQKKLNFSYRLEFEATNNVA